MLLRKDPPAGFVILNEDGTRGGRGGAGQVPASSFRPLDNCGCRRGAGPACWAFLSQTTLESFTSLSSVLLLLLPGASKVLDGTLPGACLDVKSVLA